MTYVRDPDTPLLKISSADHFTLRDAFTGVLGMGGSGSGKTTGSVATLAKAYMRAGMGGVVTVTKPGERDQWLQWARECGRENSVMVLSPHRGHFNPIQAEFARHGPAGADIAVEFMMRLMEIARLAGASPGQVGDQFWLSSTSRLFRNVVPVLYSAYGTVRIADAVQFIASAPTSADELHSEEWQRSAFFFRSMLTAAQDPRHAMSQADLQKTSSYWRDEWAPLYDKTRSNISITVTTTLDRLNHGVLNQIFCGDTDVWPELTFGGAIIILDLPVLVHQEDGIIAQQIFKYAWQRAVLSRNALAPQHRDRPVFLFSDEYQYFVNSFDADYQAVCRSSRACTAYFTQNLPSVYAKIGGENPQHRAEMLLGNLATKIFHANADTTTNQWASQTVGRTLQRKRSYSDSENSGGSRSTGTSGGKSWNSGGGVSYSPSQNGGVSSSTNWGGGGNSGWNKGSSTSWGESSTDGFSEAMESEIEPGEFASLLKTGGPANGGEVSAIWFQAGRRFAESGRNYLYARFQQ